jgi:hypothetical protein
MSNYCFYSRVDLQQDREITLSKKPMVRPLFLIQSLWVHNLSGASTGPPAADASTKKILERLAALEAQQSNSVSGKMETRIAAVESTLETTRKMVICFNQLNK